MSSTPEEARTPPNAKLVTVTCDDAPKAVAEPSFSEPEVIAVEPV